jgi:hypothetical protein
MLELKEDILKERVLIIYFEIVAISPASQRWGSGCTK